MQIASETISSRNKNKQRLRYLYISLYLPVCLVGLAAGWYARDIDDWMEIAFKAFIPEKTITIKEKLPETEPAENSPPHLTVSTEANENPKVIANAIVSAYTTSEEEGTTCISASGKNICYRDENIIACPKKYEFGTKFEIEGKIYTCYDRMRNGLAEDERYFDIYYFFDLPGALKWGRKNLEIKILE